MMANWDTYYAKNKDRPLRPLYQKAISLFNGKALVAMDLGCGAGTEVIDLLQKGFVVHAIDQEAMAIELVRANAPNNTGKLHTQISKFENLKEWPKLDFFYAFHSLPFCSPAHFAQVVDKTLSAIAPGGLYVASFFGPEDEWVVNGNLVGISAEAVQLKFKNFEILHFEESKKIGGTAAGNDKMWHVIEIIAKKV